MREFLDFRASLARTLQRRWLGRLASYRKSKPDLDIVLTHIDDRFDPTMRERYGVVDRKRDQAPATPTNHPA